MPTFNAFRFNPPNWLILLCTMMLTPFPALASEAIRTELLDNYVFASEMEAVKAMKQHCIAESSRDNAEHVGAILQSEDGRFMVTHGQANPGQESVTFSIRRRKSVMCSGVVPQHPPTTDAPAPINVGTAAAIRSGVSS